MLLNFLFFTMISCYYKIGHEIIGEIVDTLLDKQISDNILYLTGIDNIKNISSWADSSEVRKNRKYSWATELHFLTTNDNPFEGNCFIDDFKEDSRNLYTAITNYTKRITFDKTDSESLKFLVHFYQDLFQPLHMSGSFKGGNDFNVFFGKRKANIHQVWDSLLIEYNINKRFGRNRDEYVKHLVKIANVFTLKDQGSTDIKKVMTFNNKLNCECIYNNTQESSILSEEYIKRGSGLIDFLLVNAGVSLSRLIKDIYIYKNLKY